MKIEQFQLELQKYNIELTSKQISQFERYYRLLIEWNEKINLTAITDKDEVYVKHFYDSLSAAFFFPIQEQSSLSICDVGAGAGFPSIPLKIVFPHLKVTIVDSLNKRITFLKELANALELENVHFYHDRAEIFGRAAEHREQYDVVTARAVAKLSVLSEFCLPLVKVNGHFIALKGSSGNEELEEGRKAIEILGGQVDKIYPFTLPEENSERTIIQIRKVKNTPKKYPRKPGVPIKTPLN
ncbi:16S rRNA (guanine(527)-N(7))-methyltransferase RsmG [Caldibacillus lycopersici]|uniref:Ribosomal RNA small subunit methyltransferase G n=1 Tax=Perspicuibacillus lycopersici TaxID=1325689 RepID=A0AAE3LME1_9BACI|nr:16S rRNA (guanine(527)-N(7))-methyltransferase RsmG [Perspicuibacillus lycopersici]MCU9613480.1 16S rRNA (guanine(527)-N(7))-methyltransferase RsmG [Perspicuibacillus lycopersici]